MRPARSAHRGARRRARIRRRTGLAGLALALLAVGTAVFVGLTRADPSRTSGAHARQIAQDAPPRAEIVFSAWSEGGSRVYRMHPDGSGLRRLMPPNGAVLPAISTEGRLIAFETLGRPNSIYVMNADGTGRRQTMWHTRADGTHLRELGHFWSFTPPAWSPDGMRIAFLDPGVGGLVVMRANGSGERFLARVPWHDQDCNVAWSPDGKRLSFSQGARAAIHLVDITGTRLAPLEAPRDPCGLSWGAIAGP